MSILISSCSSDDTLQNSYEDSGMSVTEQTVTDVSDTVLITQTDESSDLFRTDETSEKESEQEGRYDFYTEVVEAEDLLECNYYTMPETIEDSEYAIEGVYDENNLLIAVTYDGLLAEDSRCGIGLYNCENDSFTKFFDIDTLGYVIYHDERYILLSVYSEKCLMVYDIVNDECNKFLNMPFDMELMNFKPVRYGDSLFIDTCEYTEDRSRAIPSIYKYDLISSEVSLYKSNCEKLFMIDGKECVVTDNSGNGYFNRVCFTDNLDDELFTIENNTSDLFYVDGNFYCEKGGSKSQIIDMTNDKTIIATFVNNGEALSNLSASDYYLSWYDLSGDKSIPCVYDIKSGKLAQFSALEQRYYRTNVNNNCGVIYEVSRNGVSGSTVCIFSGKES